MSYIPLYNFLPKLAMRETRTITIYDPNHALPVGDYGLVEMYCDEPECDCRRVFLNVMSSVTERSVAVIAYGWESTRFYAKWAYMGDDIEKLSKSELNHLADIKGPCLNFASPQSKYALDVLKLVTEVSLSDKAYVDRLKRHYRLFKDKLSKRGGKA